MNCDKCGKWVLLHNDALSLQTLIQHDTLPTGMERLSYGARHLLPIGNCEGSPSRAQYLDGQPKDTRGYAYVTENETPIRDAYQRLQALSYPDLERHAN